MSPAEQLIARLRNTRLSWLEVAPGRKVQVLRPTEVEMITERSRGALEVATAQVVGWEGFTEATLLGAALASDTPVPFDAQVWAAYVADNADLTAAVAVEVRRLVAEYLERKQEQAKN